MKENKMDKPEKKKQNEKETSKESNSKK